MAEFKGKATAGFGQGGQHFLPRWDHFFANAITGDASDFVSFHAVLKRVKETALYLGARP
jgi:hypothetical protein